MCITIQGRPYPLQRPTHTLIQIFTWIIHLTHLKQHFYLDYNKFLPRLLKILPRLSIFYLDYVMFYLDYAHFTWINAFT